MNIELLLMISVMINLALALLIIIKNDYIKGLNKGMGNLESNLTEIYARCVRLDSELELHKHKESTRVGLWAIDQDPKEVSLAFIRDNAFQIK